MLVRDLMTREPAFCRPDTKLREVARMMSDHDCGILPVVDGDRLIGVITDRDVTCRGFIRGTNPLEVEARHVMTVDPAVIDEEATIERAAQVMERERVRRVPVLRHGALVGVLSESEVVNVLPDGGVAQLARRVAHSHRVLY